MSQNPQKKSRAPFDDSRTSWLRAASGVQKICWPWVWDWNGPNHLTHLAPRLVPAETQGRLSLEAKEEVVLKRDPLDSMNHMADQAEERECARLESISLARNSSRTGSPDCESY